MPKGFKPDQSAIARFLGPGDGPGTPFGRELNRFGREVRDAAKRKALVGYSRKDRPGSSGGKLRDSVRMEPVRYGASGLEVVVSAYRREKNADVALIIHQGHKEIRPKDVDIKFFARDKGRGGTKYVRIRATREGPTEEGFDRVSAGLSPRGKGYVRAVGGHPFLTRALEEAAIDKMSRPGTGGGGAVRYRVVIFKRSDEVKALPPKRSRLYLNR